MRKWSKEASVHLRIGEGKALGDAYGASKVDSYCIIKVDNEEVVRTATAWKTEIPFWGEEYDVSLPIDWKELSIYCSDETSFSNKLQVLGKITLTRQHLSKLRGCTIEQWYPLTPAGNIDEVRGEILLELLLKHTDPEVIKNSTGYIPPYHLEVNLVEARGVRAREEEKRSELTVDGKAQLLSTNSESNGANGNNNNNNNNNNPRSSLLLERAASTFMKGMGNGSNYESAGSPGADIASSKLANPCVRMCVQVLGETSLVEQASEVRFNTLTPKWNQSFMFELAQKDDGTWDDSAVLYVTLVDAGNPERFLGEVTIPLIELEVNRVCSAWYSLFPRQDPAAMAATAAFTDAAVSGGSPSNSKPTVSIAALPKVEDGTKGSVLNLNDAGGNGVDEVHSGGSSSGSSSAQSAAAKKIKCGSIRLKIKYEEDKILPVAQYDPLLKLLLHSLTGPDALATGAVAVLEEVMSDREDVARALVKIFMDQELVTCLLNALASREIKAVVQPTTLFRGSSLSTKSVEQFMKLFAIPYLNATLKAVVDKVFSEKLPCEIDPNKIPKDQDVATNASNLRRYMSMLLDDISNSVDACPLPVRQVYKHLQDRVSERFSDDKKFQHLRYVVVSSFLFLRFFSPALLAPKGYGLSDSHPDAFVSRTLTLIAKTLQTLANLGQRSGGAKEEFMTQMDPFIIENVARVRLFIDHLTQVNGAVEFRSEHLAHAFASSTLKEGELFKYTTKRGLFGSDSASFKKRSCKLDDRALTIINTSTNEVCKRVRNDDIVSVEKVDAKAFGRRHVLQVSSCNRKHADTTLYLAAVDVNDQNDWLSALRNAGGRNPNVRQHYHPGAYRSGRWTCCKLLDYDAEGCNKTHPLTASLDLRLMSVSRELNRIYRQLSAGLPKLLARYNSETNPSDISKQRLGASVRSIAAVISDLERMMHD